MCNTPKSKHSSHWKALASSISILVTMNSRQRQAFAARANEAGQLLQKIINKIQQG